MRKLVYIAGPFRARTAWRIEQNIRAVELVQRDLLSMGFSVCAPHPMFRFFDGVERDRVFLENTMQLLERCHGLVALSNWTESEGSRAEWEWAGDHSLPRFVWPAKEDLIAWRNS